MAQLFASKRLFRTADDKIVTEDDPAAAFLFATEGDEISAADADRYGLKASSKLVTSSGPDAEEKAADAPADKAAKPPANKGR